ncbi:MAG: hypothetical protein M1832_002312 [Thelocarpon impressellum]|nr:MAG: hypothetical protein M1832_002312 [Thelocarpon impressellum]
MAKEDKPKLSTSKLPTPWTLKMPSADDDARSGEIPGSQPASASRQRRNWMRNVFAVPSPVKQLFDRFPIVTYPANPLPRRGAARTGGQRTLYIFSTEEDARLGRPSFNPSCLKWQTYLRFCDVEVQAVASNNHASPSGALPFMLPAASSHPPFALSQAPIPSNKLVEYVQKLGADTPKSEPADMRYDAYLALIDHRIRRVWLHLLYLDPRHSEVAQRLYVTPCSSNGLVRATTWHQLRGAALAELSRQGPLVDVRGLYSEAEKAWEALSTLLGQDTWFFGSKHPGLFDASVFAYTHLLLHGGEAGWWGGEGVGRAGKLVKALSARENLVDHRTRVSREFYGSKAEPPL